MLLASQTVCNPSSPLASTHPDPPAAFTPATQDRADFSHMEKLAGQHSLFRSTQGEKLQGRNWLAKPTACGCPASTLPPPSSPRKRSQKLQKYWILVPFVFNRGRGGVGERGVLAASRTLYHPLTGRTHPASKDNSSLVLGPTHQCHTGSPCKGHKEQTTIEKLYFHRRRCKPDGLKEHYTLDLAGRLVIYNNKFAVKEHRGLMSFPYFKEILLPPTKSGLFLS